MSDEVQALQERIAKAKAARGGAEAAEEQRAEIARLEREARIAENALRDDPHVAAARQKHGDRVSVIDTDLGAVVVKKPHHLKFNEVVSKGDKMTHHDLVGLVRSCVVYPEWTAVDKMLEEAPAALGVIVEAITKLATEGAKARSGK